MEIEFLGTGQDEAAPKLDCSCNQCKKGLERNGSAIKVSTEEAALLVDMPPDIKQSTSLKQFDSILLTHAHIGHYGGMFFLGRESYDTDERPVYCSEEMAEWLRAGNKAYSHLVERRNIELNSLEKGEWSELHDLEVKPVEVVHRNEDADTVGFMFRKSGKKIYYMPDLDHWTENPEKAVREADIAIVDGTFYSVEEEIGADREVPHPEIPETAEKFSGCDTEIYFTHLNHTNPVADSESEEHEEVEENGFNVAEDGEKIEL